MAKKKSKTNPNGANQYLSDPRQILFFEHFLDPKSETFSNALQSALKAGFSETYAKHITAQMPTWLSEKLRNVSMLKKAERNLDQILDLETEEDVIAMFGPVKDKKTGKNIKKENPNLLRIKADTSKFVVERFNKKKKDDDENSPQINQFIQINIHKPNEKRTRHSSKSETVSSVVSPTGSEDS